MMLTPQTNLAVAQALLAQKKEIERLRDIISRLANLADNLLANYEYRYRDSGNSMAFVKNSREFISEARATSRGDKK